MSKVLNAEEGVHKLRYGYVLESFSYIISFFSCYPKFDGSIYVYDPLAKQTQEEAEELSKELEVKVVVVMI